MVLAVRQICCWNFSTALVKERSSPGENQSSSRLLWVVAIAPLEHLPCLLCTGDPQHKGSLPTPSSYVSFLLPSPSTALASLLYAWIIYTFIKKVDIQVPSTDSNRTLIWAESTVATYGAKMGLGFCLLCFHGLTMRCYCIACVICRTGSSLRLFPPSLLQEQARKRWSCAESMCHLLCSSWITAGCWLCRN